MKFVALLSGGIDSPVASYIMSLTGADVILLHMCINSCAESREIEKVKLIVRRLEEITGKHFPLYVTGYERNQSIIKEKCEVGYRCILCKRIMQHIAKEFAKKNGCIGIIMGDSIGQVASQTLRNIRAEEHGLNYLVIRPLVGMDKDEIIEIAKKIGTFDISISHVHECGIVPSRPVIGADPRKVLSIQKFLDFSQIVQDSVDSTIRLN